MTSRTDTKDEQLNSDDQRPAGHMRIPPPDRHRHPEGWVRWSLRQHRGEGPMHVPAVRAQDHIDRLVAWGLRPVDIADAAGVDITTVLYHHHRQRVRIPRQYEAALLAVTWRPHPSQGHVLSIGASRRVYALTAIGWSLAWQADRLGYTVANLSQALAHPRMPAALHAAVTDLYDEVVETRGPSKRAITWARKRGTPGPWSWDPDTIDDPEANPVRCERTAGRVVVHIEDIRWLREQAALDAAAIAARLGVTAGTVKYRLDRDERERGTA